MKKRMSVILALTMAATTMFSAVPAMAKDGDVVNITIWSPTDREQVEAWWTEKLAEWNEANPNIQVSREAIDRSDSYAYDNKIATAVTSNDLPDIFYVDGPQVFHYPVTDIPTTPVNPLSATYGPPRHQNVWIVELNNVAFKSQLGEFALYSFEPSDMASREELFLESLRVVTNSFHWKLLS